ncbi:MAG TPA: serine/threonine-protein kinase, partial [Polyangiales bacterium]
MPILTPEERVGQCLADRYRLDSLLCAGGMGVLFRGRDLLEAREVAIKMVKPAHAIEPDRVARFLRESAIARRVVHPNIARTFDAWTDPNGVPFLIMELLEGRTLACELERNGVLSWPRALAIALPIVRALEAAHACGVIHRDVKPSNIFLCDDANETVVPKLLDFGIAKSAEGPFETDTGVLLGTPGYIAPEQAQFGQCSELTDVWAIGAVLYRCLTGHAPHAISGGAELLNKLVREPVPPLMAAGVSKRAAALIDRALARDPHRRYPSMAAFGRALAECEPEGASHTAELSAPARPRARLRSALVAATSLLALSTFDAVPAGSTDGNASAPRALAAAPGPVATTPRPAPAIAPLPSTAIDAVISAAPLERPRRRLAHRPPPSAATLPLEHEATSGL